MMRLRRCRSRAIRSVLHPATCSSAYSSASARTSASYPWRRTDLTMLITSIAGAVPEPIGMMRRLATLRRHRAGSRRRARRARRARASCLTHVTASRSQATVKAGASAVTSQTAPRQRGCLREARGIDLLCWRSVIGRCRSPATRATRRRCCPRPRQPDPGVQGRSEHGLRRVRS